MRLVDLDDDRHYYCGCDGEYEKWNIDPEVPVIDPVKHGRWIDATKEIGWPVWKCSVCGGDGRGDYFVCPWCGARMDEVTE